MIVGNVREKGEYCKRCEGRGEVERRYRGEVKVCRCRECRGKGVVIVRS